MSSSSDDGNGCLALFVIIIVIGLLCTIIPPMCSAYGDAVSGPNGGAWLFPVILLIIAIICYFKDHYK